MLDFPRAVRRRVATRSRRATILAGSTVLVAALVASCSSVATGDEPSPTPAAAGSSQQTGAQSPSETPPAGAGSAVIISDAKVVIRLAGDWGTLDPQNILTQQDSQVSAFLYNRLVRLNKANEPVPDLATSWDVTPDHVTFTIRKDAVCQDGTPITPSVIDASFARLLSPDNTPAKRASVFGTAGVTTHADDAKWTFTVTVDKPQGDLLESLATDGGSVICPSGLEAGVDLSAEPAGSGPYQLTSVKRGSQYTLTAWDGYWGFKDGTAAANPPQQIVFEVVPNETTAANQFLTGDIDILSLTGRDLDRVLQQQPDVYKQETVWQSGTLIYNAGPGHPTADQAVRTAIGQAIDRDAFATVATNKPGNTASGAIVPPTPCSDPSALAQSIPTFDVAAAAAGLEQAGWAKGSDGIWQKDGQPLALNLVATSSRIPGGEYILDALTKFGLKVNYQDVDLKTFINITFSTDDFDAAIFPMTAGKSYSPKGAIGHISGEPTPAGPNLLRAADAEANEYFDSARQTPVSQSCDDWIKGQQLQLSHADYTPLASFPVTVFSRPGIEFRLADSATIEPSAISVTDSH